MLTAASAAVIDRITYDGFGNIIAETNPSASDRYLWTGREFDRVTVLQYNRTRYYDPTTGRWTTEDSIGFEAGDANLYRYIGNNPTNATDPDGTRSALDFIKGVIAQYGGTSTTRAGLDYNSLSISVSKTFFLKFPLFGPFSINVNVAVAGTIAACCTKTHFIRPYFQGSVTVEGYVAVGYTYKPPRKLVKKSKHNNPKNNRYVNPNNPKGPSIKGKNHPPTGLVPNEPGYRERSGYVNIPTSADIDNCPDSWWSGSFYWFIRGSIGAYFVGFQVSYQNTITATADISPGGKYTYSAATGVVGVGPSRPASGEWSRPDSISRRRTYAATCRSRRHSR